MDRIPEESFELDIFNLEMLAAFAAKCGKKAFANVMIA